MQIHRFRIFNILDYKVYFHYIFVPRKYGFLKYIIRETLGINDPYCNSASRCKRESTFLKDASYQIWFKSVQWFWRRGNLKEKFTPDDRRRTGRWALELTWAFGSGELKIHVVI